MIESSELQIARMPLSQRPSHIPAFLEWDTGSGGGVGGKKQSMTLRITEVFARQGPYLETDPSSRRHERRP
jgi:hypothetical protein